MAAITAEGSELPYLEPTRLHDALRCLGAGPCRIVAGGTDVYPAQGECPFKGDMLGVGCIEGLRGIRRTALGDVRIGAATTWTDIIKADLPPAFDALKAAGREVGSVQIQNAGTLAGNLCNASPAADGVPPLLALDAQVEVTSLKAKRLLPLSEFILGVRRTALGQDEMVTSVIVPDRADRERSAFVKLGARKYLVISIAMVAVNVSVKDGLLSGLRIAVGACSPVAQRLKEMEMALTGLSLQDAVGALRPEYITTLAPIDDIRGSANYRREVVLPLIAQALTEAAGE